jgi:hypothetical protein
MDSTRTQRTNRGQRWFRRAALIAGLAGVSLALAACDDIYGTGDRNLEIIWPREGTTLYDEEVLRARLRGYNVDDYDIYWYVDDSREWRMATDRQARPPQKLYVVDTWLWDWRGRGPYTVGFVAVDRRDREIAHRTVRVYVR